MRIFKSTDGVSPYQHLLNQRVERARTLLPDQTWTLAEVALRGGFSRQEHLSWMFRRFTGVAPGRYRRASNWNFIASFFRFRAGPY